MLYCRAVIISNNTEEEATLKTLIRIKTTLLFTLSSIMLMLAFVSIAPQTVNAQPASLWTVQFYNNNTVSGSPVYFEQVQYISYNWGINAPITGMVVDDFSATMSTTTFLQGGTYRFFMRADDGARVYIDNILHFNTFDQTRPDDLLSRDVTLATGAHTIRIEYREVSGPAFIYFTWQDASTNPTIPDFAPGPNNEIPISGGNWTAEYFNNNNLFGSPVAIISEPTPTHNWGSGSPIVNVAPDNFSVRYTSTLDLTADTYIMTISADDGFRVFVDGILQIEQWGGATGLEYTRRLNLISGQHTIMIEYVEFRGLAFLEFSLIDEDALTPITTPQPDVNVTGGTLQVNTSGNLNVRNIPSTSGSTVVARIRDDETYPIVGRTADSSWWQIDIDGVIGWVSTRFVDTFNTSNVPVTDNTVAEIPTLTGERLQTTSELNMRSRASTRGSILAVIPRFTSVDIVGRNSSGQWLKVFYDGVAGWVSADFIRMLNGAQISDLPIVN